MRNAIRKTNGVLDYHAPRGDTYLRLLQLSWPHTHSSGCHAVDFQAMTLKDVIEPAFVDGRELADDHHIDLAHELGEVGSQLFIFDFACPCKKLTEPTLHISYNCVLQRSVPGVGAQGT